MTTTPAFVLPAAPIAASAIAQQNAPHDAQSPRHPPGDRRASRTCTVCKRGFAVSRRSVLQKCLLAASAFVLGSSSKSARAADAASQQQPGGGGGNDSVCSNCQGSGKVPCELCAGTGFWRAISGNDPRQRYKGVVCPECEGVGTLTCPVCLGTGEGNIKGLLRRRRVEPGPGRILQS